MPIGITSDLTSTLFDKFQIGCPTGSNAKRLVLPSGDYLIKFGEALWPVTLPGGEITIVEPALLTIKNNGYHDIRDPETGERMMSYGSNEKRLVMAPGDYDVMFGKKPWRIDVKSGETLVLEPAVLRIANNHYHDIQDAETGKRIVAYGSSTKQLPLPPGQYKIEFGEALWPISVEAGEELTINPGGIGIRPKSYQTIYFKDGTKAGTLGSSADHHLFPAGDYYLEIEAQKVPVKVRDGKVTLIKLQ